MRRMHPNRRTFLDIERDLLPTDRVFQRWSRSVGSDLPVTDWTGDDSARATELPPDAAIAVDRYVCSRIKRMQSFLHCWYRGQETSAKIAKRFGVGRDEVYVLWRATLIVAQRDLLQIPCVAAVMKVHSNYLEAA